MARVPHIGEGLRNDGGHEGEEHVREDGEESELADQQVTTSVGLLTWL